jgi:H+/Cl- antiporter ClcA
MQKKHWILGIFTSLALFLYSFFSQGTNNFSGVEENFKHYLGVLGNNRLLIVVAILLGIFVGFIFWLIKNFGEKKEYSEKKWVIRSLVLFIFIFLIIWAVVNTINILAN